MTSARSLHLGLKQYLKQSKIWRYKQRHDQAGRRSTKRIMNSATTKMVWKENVKRRGKNNFYNLYFGGKVGRFLSTIYQI